MPSKIPGAVPRNLDATYRGNLTKAGPECQSRRDGSEMITARMGSNLAASTVPAELRKDLTEWIDLIATSPAMMARLERCQGGELVCVTGPVTLKPYEHEDGKVTIDRTLFVEYIRAASASMADMDKDNKAAPGPSQLPSGDEPPDESGEAGDGASSSKGDDATGAA